MSQELIVLSITAASIGFFHTLLGPDHYLPFIVMGRARRWSLSKTALITFLCGIGHIMSSVVLGIAGIILGIAVMRLEGLEALRGNLAAWVLMGFGLAYFVWGLRMAFKNRPHRHVHDYQGITPWVLFTIFVLGPCEPLIPILMYPAAKNSIMGLIWVTAVFGTATTATMVGIVTVASFGVNLIPLGRLERYAHALAGATIFFCGIAIQLLVV